MLVGPGRLQLDDFAGAGARARRQRRRLIGAESVATEARFGELFHSPLPDPAPFSAKGLSLFVLVAVADAVKRLHLGEFAVHHAELLAQALDMAVDGAVIDIDMLAIGGVHQLVAALHMSGPRG